jgi:hypothetical protein
MATIDRDLYWTSGSDLGSEGQFYWASTGQVLGIYDNFDHPLQPDNANKSEHCLELRVPRLNLKNWNDRSCDRKSRYICEYKNCAS